MKKNQKLGVAILGAGLLWWWWSNRNTAAALESSGSGGTLSGGTSVPMSEVLGLSGQYTPTIGTIAPQSPKERITNPQGSIGQYEVLAIEESYAVKGVPYTYTTTTAIVPMKNVGNVIKGTHKGTVASGYGIAHPATVSKAPAITMSKGFYNKLQKSIKRK